MSFNINWESIKDNDLSSFTVNLLNQSLNSGKRPNILSSDIKIIDLNFGSIAPLFEILEIGDLDHDKFRGIFKFKYNGNASITINTKIQASPLKNYEFNILDNIYDSNGDDTSASSNHDTTTTQTGANGSTTSSTTTTTSSSAISSNIEEYSNDINMDFINPKFNLSNCNFDIPLNLSLSNIKLSSIIIIVFSKSKGLTLVFKNDPLESISINSTFDNIKPVANFLKSKIELQITEIFKEFLPSLLYNLSLKYTNSTSDNLSDADFHNPHNPSDDLGNDEHKRVNLIDLDNENSLKILPGSLMRLTTLLTSKLTLSLNELTDINLNNNIISKSSISLLNHQFYMKNNNNNLLINQFQLSPNQLDQLHHSKLSKNLFLIKEFQNKFFQKSNNYGINNNGNEEKKSTIKPKRRVIKMGKSKSSTTPTSNSAVASPNPSSITSSTTINEISSVPMSYAHSANTTLIDESINDITMNLKTGSKDHDDGMTDIGTMSTNNNIKNNNNGKGKQIKNNNSVLENISNGNNNRIKNKSTSTSKSAPYSVPMSMPMPTPMHSILDKSIVNLKEYLNLNYFNFNPNSHSPNSSASSSPSPSPVSHYTSLYNTNNHNPYPYSSNTLSLSQTNMMNTLNQFQPEKINSGKYHINKDEKLKIDSRRIQLDKMFNSSQNQNDNFIVVPPPPYYS